MLHFYYFMLLILIHLLSHDLFFFFFFLMIRRPPRSTLFPSRRSSDLPKRWLLRDPDLPGDQLRSKTARPPPQTTGHQAPDRKSTRLNSSHVRISYAVFCLKKKKKKKKQNQLNKKKQTLRYQYRTHTII